MQNFEIDIRKASQAKTPVWQREVTATSNSRALEGGFLLQTQREEGWLLQGISLLWSAACDFPELVPELQQAYGLDMPPDVCSKPVRRYER
jgi:hypothetical protein